MEEQDPQVSHGWGEGGELRYLYTHSYQPLVWLLGWVLILCYCRLPSTHAGRVPAAEGSFQERESQVLAGGSCETGGPKGRQWSTDNIYYINYLLSLISNSMLIIIKIYIWIETI